MLLVLDDLAGEGGEGVSLVELPDYLAARDLATNLALFLAMI
jgi:preprotein translocase subunit SecA